MSAIAQSFPETDSPMARTLELFREQKRTVIEHTDRIFARLMVCQWFAGIAAALLISPRSWAGTESRIHVHFWAAILLGGLVTSLPVYLAWRQPGRVLTR